MVMIKQPTIMILNPGIIPERLRSPNAYPIAERIAVPKTAHHVLSWRTSLKESINLGYGGNGF